MTSNNSKKLTTHLNSAEKPRLRRAADIFYPHGNPEKLRAKILEDISFLQSQIKHIKRARGTLGSPVMLTTYQSMLESKENMLALIDENLTNIEFHAVSNIG